MTFMPSSGPSLFDFLPDYIQPTMQRSPVNRQRMGGQDEIASLLGDPTALAGQLGAAAPPARKPLSGFQQMKDRFFGVPEGLSGLLSPEDLSGAQHEGMLGLGLSLLANSGPRTVDQQVTPMQSIGQALQAAKGAHAGSLQNAVGTRSAAMDFEAKKMQLERAKSLDAGRKGIIAKYPMPQGGDRDAMLRWIEQVLPRFIEINDDETRTSLTEIYKSLGGSQSKQPGEFVTVPGPDGKPMRRYITSSESVREYERPQQGTRAHPRLVPLINPATGKPELAEYDPNSRKINFTGHRPTTTGAGSEAERKAQAIFELSAPHVSLLDEADAPDRIEQMFNQGKLNEFIEENRQLFNISGRQLADAYLRLTTGAAYNKEELEQAVILMTPQPGDKPKAIQLKRANRKRLINALRAAAGRAYGEVDMNVGVELNGMDTGSSSGSRSQPLGRPPLEDLWEESAQ